MSRGESQIIIYKARCGSVSVKVKLQGETLWITQKQMSTLFETERSVITKHLRNIFKSKELEEKSVSAKFAHTAEDGKTYLTTFYNLDAILSVGYRVNSKRGTEFRIWATQVLRDHIVRGYSVNERRLRELNQAIRLIASVAERRLLTGEEATSLLRVVADYSFALDLLDAYDRQAIKPTRGSRREVKRITIEEARKTIDRLREHYQAGSLFGREKDDSLTRVLGHLIRPEEP